MGNYFLIARDINTNYFKIIELKSKWYLKNGNDILHRSNRLEAIDLVTTRFSSKQDMAKRLVEKNIIDHDNYDFYIVNRYKRNNNLKLAYQEVIYNVKESRTDYFRKICIDSLNNNLKSKNNIRLIDYFINKNYYNCEFNKIVKDGLTGVNYKFSNLFQDIHNYETIPYNMKYKNSWCLDNYLISRNIVDSFNRFDELNTNNLAYQNHIAYFNTLAKERMAITKSL